MLARQFIGVKGGEERHLKVGGGSKGRPWERQTTPGIAGCSSLWRNATIKLNLFDKAVLSSPCALAGKVHADFCHTSLTNKYVLHFCMLVEL